MTEKRIENIEISLAHQEGQIQDLNDMINLQWKEIERLKLLLEKAQSKIAEIENISSTGGDQNSIAEIAASEKPPHY